MSAPSTAAGTSSDTTTDVSGASVGLLVVGIGGANGTTLMAGLCANRRRPKLSWRGPRGEPTSANYNGCITQLDQRGVHGGVGYRDKLLDSSGRPQLADFNRAAVGGWDIRGTPLGDALLEQQVLDYDLVRQVRDEMNSVDVMRGCYDARFIGTSQHETATHVFGISSAALALGRLRKDIRDFKCEHGLMERHTTVIWSASVEPNSELCAEGTGRVDTAEQLLRTISQTDEGRGGPLPPSLLYAAAAALEGCSFVNGGSQNTLCGGLEELSRRNRCYCLGTDFKAGQTKFKTAAVEYLRTMGLTPKVIASSNHLGNNDMRNLASADKARMAKLRVKHDIFAAWNEDIDHKVSVMFCPQINDEKRDFVEYTSFGFLDQVHTMVTYTRASDSVLCVPLMVDAAVWCDFFARRGPWGYDEVGKALAYLFKVPEGAAKGVDPGFFRQMEGLNAQALAASGSPVVAPPVPGAAGSDGAGGVRWAIPGDDDGGGGGVGIICAGLACVDMQLGGATGGGGGEGIDTFRGETSIGGGSVSMACKALAKMCHENSTPVVRSVIPLCKVGSDDTGTKLLSLLESNGAASNNVVSKFTRSARDRCGDGSARTALAVLPIYDDGRRGCFFDAASNDTFDEGEMTEMLEEATTTTRGGGGSIAAFLFGYPHLLPRLRGEALGRILSKARDRMERGGITALDLNGVPEADAGTGRIMRTVKEIRADPVLGAALPNVDVLHMNEEELSSLTGCGPLEARDDNDETISRAASLFLEAGVAVVAVTRGKDGCFVACSDEGRFSNSKRLPQSWAGCVAKVPGVKLSEGTVVNSNGAGDAFTAGLLVAASLRTTGTATGVVGAEESLGLESAAQFANLVASRHIDSSSRDSDRLNVTRLLQQALTRAC